MKIKLHSQIKILYTKGQMVQINNDAQNDKPVPYGVKCLICLKNKESTSFEIMLVDVLCDCSWFILKIFNGLVYYGLSKASKTNWESVRIYSVLDMSARPVSQAGV